MASARPAVVRHPVQAFGYLTGELVQQTGIIVRHPVAVADQHFGQFLVQVQGTLGEVFDEIERVADLVGHARHQLAQGRQLFLGYQPGLHALQLGVGLPQFAVEPLDQVQPLHFQGLLPEMLQRVRQLADLVAANLGHRGLEIAAGHGPHPRGQGREAANDRVPHPEPSGKGGGHNADYAEHGQQHPPFVETLDRLSQCLPGVGLCLFQERRRGGLERGAVFLEQPGQVRSLAGQGQLQAAGRENTALAPAHIHDRLFQPACRQGPEILQHALQFRAVPSLQRLLEETQTLH